MRFYFIKTPRIIKILFSRYTWCFSSRKNEIYLTFDDGPIPEVTKFVLNELEKHKAKATFFCIGDNIRKYPFIFEKIIKNGHSVGNHTFNHLNGWKTPSESYLKNTLKTEALIHKTQGKKNIKLFRPPYGKIKHSQASQLLKKGYKIIMWDVLSADFDKTTTKEQCAQNVLQKVKNGSIIVFHDSIKAKEKLYYALPIVLAELSKKGYSFKGII
ncbi:Peptidoglycan/xylan/chitin deacetylase, PgdA/CDA1 family [Tenacibaculum sp. MAR_2009_124]|uniref:polysaccharide deacetylase family protein n=1 Tax=Tenacibaculum sp. MAR_2009_124 TaxID=1250059 RepID=UPI000895C0CE|nr:polysaccharide deacetylase family protein [Tenacibaculum sp. MAR_2009_124]SEB97123.1 Peptidoglycan/xylan/chitin deacetylase, PgdA/CDA1 family [Tenacibaculum sp. MAR_2009_124]